MRKLVLFVLFIIGVSNSLFAQTAADAGPAPIITAHPNSIGSAPITTPNTNKAGVVHISRKPAATAINNIVDNIAKAETFTKFYKAIQVAGLSETFRSVGPITVFIPDDAAFGKMPKGKMDTLLRSDHQPELLAFITYHAISGRLTSKYIARQIGKHKNSASFTTLSGGRLIAKLDDAHNIILVDEMGKQSTVSQNTMAQSNGMIFVISDVLMPKNRLL